MTRRPLPFAVLLAVAAGALAFRLPRLTLRPLHTDEAVEAFRTGTLYDHGIYRYDPHEYHGPTLHYATLPFLWLSGAKSFAESSEATYRLVNVVAGVGLVLLLPLLADGLGWPAAIVAGILTAISPAMVFYNRYYIHETLLVFFTLAAIGAGWRYARSGRLPWAVAAAAALALMHATKETWVLTLAAIGLALAAKLGWRKLWGEPVRVRGLIRPSHVALAAIAGLAVSVVLFSSFFTNWRGPLDSVLTFATYVERSGGAGVHDKPWHYYLGMLLYSRLGRGPWWSEGLILALAAVGIVAALWPRRRRTSEESHAEAAEQPERGRREDSTAGANGRSEIGNRKSGPSPLLRFLAFYTLILTAIYSLVPYKTPWCMMSFLHGMILLAGVGAVAVVSRVPTHLLKAAVALALAAAAWHLGTQANRAALDRRFMADRRNPYVYAHTTWDLLEVPRRAEQLAAVHPRGREMVIKVIAPEQDYWPLPFYLRRFPNVGYWDAVPAAPDADLVIASTQVEDTLRAALRGDYFTETRGLRPAVHLHLHIRRALWDAFLKQQEAAAQP